MRGAAVLLAAGDGAADPLQAALTQIATDWGREVAGAGFRVADPAASLPDEIGRAFSDHGGPLLVIWPCLPQLRPDLAGAALGDLASGCSLVLGPVIDGGLYLLGLAAAVPAVLSLPEAVWQRQDAMETAVSAAHDHGLEVGILRAERALRGEADAAAALADPLLPEAVAQLLRRPSPA